MKEILRLSHAPYGIRRAAILTVLVSIIGCFSFLTRSTASGGPVRTGNVPASVDRDKLQQIEKDKDKNRCKRCAQVGNQSIYVPLIELPEAQGGELVFNSRSTKEMSVTPVFYKRDGSVVNGKPVNIQSGEIRYADVKSLLPASRRNEHDWGGMSLNYYGGNREIWSQFRFMGVGGGGSVDEFFIVKNESRSDVQEAVWWTPRRGRALIALGNVADVKTSATVTFGDGRTQEVELPPHATEILQGEYSRDGGSESVRIHITGAPGSIIPTGVITSKDNSFNSVIRFYDTKSAKQPRLFANGLRVAGAALHMTLKNTTSATITAQPRFIPSGGDDAGAVVLPEVYLGPNETTEVDLTDLSQQAAIRNDLDVVSVQVANSGESGSLIGSIYGMDTASGLSYDVPLRDSGPVRSMTGAYPWKISAGFSTVAYVTNITDREAEYVAQINYSGGKFILAPRKLKPGETAAFDFQKIRDEQLPDDEGRTLPSNVTIGQFMWAMRGTTGGKLVLIGRAEMVSRSRKVSTSYSCPTDCGLYYDVIVDPSPDPAFVTGTSIGTAWETGTSNVGYSVGPYKATATWSVDNPIATFSDAGGGDIMATGTASGAANFTAFISMQERYDFDGLNCVDNGPYPEQTGGEMQVAPKIDNLDPNRALAGTTVTFTINGSGLKDEDSEVGESEVQIAGEGSGQSLEITQKTDNSASKITVTMNIAANATEGNHSVKVVVNGQTSNAVNFYVQYPRKLVRKAFPLDYSTHVAEDTTGISTLHVLTDGSVVGFDGQTLQAGGSALTHKCGAYRLLLYQLVDGEGQAIQPGSTTVTVNESFPSNEQSGNTGANQLTGSTTTNEVGYVVDLNAILTPAGSCLTQAYSWTGKQHFTVTVGSGSPITLSTIVQITLSFSPPSSYTISNSITTQ